MVFNRFWRPRWQHRDTKIRALAIASEQSEELLNALPKIAQDDPEPQVRLAALKRLDEPTCWSEAARKDPDQCIREQASARLIQYLRQTEDPHEASILLQHHAQDPWLATLTDAHLLQVRLAAALKGGRVHHWLAVIENSRESELKSCIEALDDIEVLAELKKRIPRQQKTAATLVEEKLDKRLLAAGDTDTIRRHAEKLCNEYATLCRESDPQILKDRLKELDQQWLTLPAHVMEEALLQRKDSLSRTILNILSAHDPEHQEKLRDKTRMDAQHLQKMLLELTTNTKIDLQQLQTQFTKLEKQWKNLPQHLLDQEQIARWLDGVHQLEQRVDELDQQQIPQEIRQLYQQIRSLADQPASQLNSQKLIQLEEALIRCSRQPLEPESKAQKLLQQSRNLLRQQVNRLEDHLQKLDHTLDKFHSKINDLQKALDKGHIQLACRYERELSALQPELESHKKLKEQERKKLGRLRAELKKNRQWLHWSNENKRKTLYEELERFSSSQPHPDAIRNKLKESWKEWQQLEESEKPLPAGKRYAANHTSWKRFNKVYKQLKSMADPYFEKKLLLQQEKLSRCKQDIQTFDQLNTEKILDDKQARDLERQRRVLINWLQRAAELPPAEKKDQVRALRKRVEQSRKKLDAVYKEWRQLKQTLIDQAETAVSSEDTMAAKQQILSLQSQWKKLPHLPHSKERQLWNQFRKHCDRVMARCEQEKALEKERAQALERQAQELIQDIQNLVCENMETQTQIKQARTNLENLRQQWKALRIDNHALQQRYDRTLQQKLAELSQAESMVENRRLARWIQDFHAQATESTTRQWPEDWQQAWLDGKARPSDETRLKNLCLQLEILADLPAMEKDRAQRMQAQIDLVQLKHEGVLPEHENEQRKWLWLQWLRSGGAELPAGHELKSRFQQGMLQWLEPREN